jgi:hypothetical protein
MFSLSFILSFSLELLLKSELEGTAMSGTAGSEVATGQSGESN